MVPKSFHVQGGPNQSLEPMARYVTPRAGHESRRLSPWLTIKRKARIVFGYTMENRNQSREAFLDTLCDPMRRLSEGESYRPIPLKDYVSQCIRLEALPTTVSRIEIHHVY